MQDTHGSVVYPRQTETRAGYVGLVGQPNAGKSSLLNALLGHKLSIVTTQAQTTRQRVVGIATWEDAQAVFLDTPGLVDPRYLLHRSMLHSVEEVLSDADVLVVVIDASAPPSTLLPSLVERIRRHRRVLAACNKADIASPESLARAAEWARQELSAQPIVVSARTGAGLAELREAIIADLPASPFFFDPEDVSSQSVRFFVSELIRETAFEVYEREIPYCVAVVIDEFAERADPVRIRATVYVERPSQKAIVIGAGGAAIKRLGAESRRKIEEFVERRVHLELWVKVLPNWRKSALSLQRFGFSVPRTEEGKRK